MSSLQVNEIGNTTSNSSIALQTADGDISINNARLYVESSGSGSKVGLGTSTPQSAFHVATAGGIRLVSAPILEKVNIVNGRANSTSNIDVLTSNVWYFDTDSNGNWTHNIRGDASNSLDSIMNVGESIVVTVISNESSGYSANINIDGAGQTEYWQGGSAPTEDGGGGFDVYTWNIIKLGAGNWRVLASFQNFA